MPNQVKWGISLLIGIGLIFLGWRVFPLLVTMHILLCFLLIVVVLLQSGKAADLAGAFGGAGSQTAFGPRGAATFLSRATTWCAIMFMLTSMALVLRQDRQLVGGGSILRNKPASNLPLNVPPTQPLTPPQTPASEQPQPPPPSAPAKTQPPKK